MVEETTTAASPAAELQRRLKREKIYREKLPIKNGMKTDSGRILKPAPTEIRNINFKKFVMLYFTVDDHPNNADPNSADFMYSTTLKEGSSGYDAFRRFAFTDYGSAVIKEMLDNQKKYQGFSIMEGVGKGATADNMAILLPKNFPARKKFNHSFGQEVYDLAVIYHEFAHTSVFRGPKSQGRPIETQDERTAVIYFENPVRISKGYEPRYSYTTRDQSQTINIITGDIGIGVLLVHQDDPTKLVSPTDPDALR